MTKILDLSAGNRAIWFDKNEPLCTFVDIRGEVCPDVVADSRSLPEDWRGKYDLVVFDPPHVNFGASAQLSQTYGHHTTQEIREIISGTAAEAWRVVRLGGLMAFKWNDHDQKLNKVLTLLTPYWRPLFGHKVSQRTKHSSMTYWVILIRENLEGSY